MLLLSSNMNLHTRIQQSHIFCKQFKIMICPIIAIAIDKMFSTATYILKDAFED